MRYRYTGGVQVVDVVLGERVVSVATGDTIEVSAAEAERLDLHPEFVKVKTSTSAKTPTPTTPTTPTPELDEPGTPED